MTFTIEKTKLLNALQRLNKVTPQRSTLPILGCVLFDIDKKSIKLRATDLEQTIIIEIPIKSSDVGKTAVPIKTLLEITQEIPDKNINFSIGADQKIELITKTGSYRIMGKSAKEFPEIPTIENPVNIDLSYDELKEIINDTLYAASKDDMKISLQGVCLNVEKDSITAVATDGFRLVKRLSKMNGSTEFSGSVIIPSKFLSIINSHINKKTKISLLLGTNHIQIENEETIILSRIIKEKYPDYESIIPTDNDKKIELNREALLSAVKRVSIFSNRTTKQVTLSFENNMVTVDTEDAENMTAGNESVDCKYDGKALSIGFNANFLKELLSHQPSDELTIKLKSSLGAGMFYPIEEKSTREIVTLLMPIRI